MKKKHILWIAIILLSINTITFSQTSEIKNKIVENIKANLRTGTFFINGSKDGDNINYYYAISDVTVSGDDSKYTWSYKWEFVISKPAICGTPHGCDWWIKGNSTSSMSYSKAVKQLAEDKILNMNVFTDTSLKPFDTETCQVTNVTTNNTEVFTDTSSCMAFVPYQIGTNGENGAGFKSLLKQLSSPAISPPDISTDNSNDTDKVQIERINRLKRKIT